MIKELLQYSLVSAKGDPFRSIDLDKVVKEVLEDLEVSIKNSNVIVQTESLRTVEADPTQMRQLFLNLISNAIKFKKRKRKLPKLNWSLSRTKKIYGIFL